MGEIKVCLLLIVGIVSTNEGRYRLNEKEKQLVDSSYLDFMELRHISSTLSLKDAENPQR